jgi:hypothetical protein
MRRVGGSCEDALSLLNSENALSIQNAPKEEVMSRRTFVRIAIYIVAPLLASNGVMNLSRQSLAPFGTGAAFAQIDAGHLADVRDLQMAVTYLNVENRTDVVLSLVPAQPTTGPGVTLVFRARFPGRTIDVNRLSEIVVRAHYRVMSDDRARSARAINGIEAMHMNLDPRQPGGVTLAFFPTNWGYGGFIPPGDEMPVAYFMVTPADLRAIAVARAVTGQVLWTDFVLTPNQVEALRQFAVRVLPPVS